MAAGLAQEAGAAEARFLGLGGQEASEISADGGTVIGHNLLTPEGPARAWWWTAGGGRRDLPMLNGNHRHTRANGVSADGSFVAGHVDQPDGNSFRVVPVLWDVRPAAPAPPRVLDTSGAATAVSADGKAAFGFADANNFLGVSAAVRWTLEGQAVRRTELRVDALALDATPGGSVVVGDSPFAGRPGRAFRWEEETGAVPLGALPGHSYSHANAVSADGSAVVGYSGSDSSEAFLWTEGGGMRGLGDLPGGRFTSTATDVTGDGSVVVGFANDAAGVTYFAWDQANGMRELRQVLEEDFGLSDELAGWRLAAPSAPPPMFHLAYHLSVSADGTVLAGTGINPQGQQEAWVASLPAPLGAPYLVADANADGKVDVSDLGILATNFNENPADPAGKSGGDFDGDGAVTVADLGILATHFGQPGLGAGAGAPSASFEQALAAFPDLPAVPEPASLGLLALGGPGLLARRRLRRRP